MRTFPFLTCYVEFTSKLFTLYGNVNLLVWSIQDKSFWSGPRADMAVQSTPSLLGLRPRWCPWSAPEGLYNISIHTISLCTVVMFENYKYKIFPKIF